MQITLATAEGEQHGLINIIPNMVPDDGFKTMSPENRSSLEKAKKDDNKIVKAEYLNSRGQHERLMIAYCKYAGDPIRQYNFIPGYKYDVPLGLVKQVNDKARIMPKRSGLTSVDGNPLKKDESPIEGDTHGDWLHRFVAPGF